jgi:cyanophycinase
MKRHVASIAALIVLVAVSAARAALPPQAPKGHLVIVGGGTIPDSIRLRALELAGGPATKVVVFPQASELPETGETHSDAFRKLGAAHVRWIDVKDAPAAVRAVEEAGLIWFPGGDQVRLMKAFEGTGIAEAIVKRYREGATVAGTSAGAAVMSKVMITGDADLLSITNGATKTVAGLGLWPEAVVDQHFLKRQRHSRLISLVLDNPGLVGVGIDEQTAVVVSGRRFDVIGNSAVVVFDARKAEVARTKPGQLDAAGGVAVSVLTAGMGFDMDTGKPSGVGR